MGYNSNTKSLEAPLNTWSVAKCIMASNGDLATLCQSTNINPKSMNKPVRYIVGDANYDNHPQELTVEEWLSTNYGIKINNSFSDLSEMATAISNSLTPNFYPEEGKTTGWAFYYDKPKNGDMCRLTDFIGYKHYPLDWVEVSFDNHGNTTENNTRLRLWFREALSGGLADIKSWGASEQFFDGNDNFIGTLCLLVCTKANNAYTATYLLPLLKGLDWDFTEDVNPIFNAQFSGVNAGNYFVYPIITDAQNLTINTAINANELKQSGYKFLPFPYGSFTAWNPVASGTPGGGNPPIANSISVEFDDKEGFTIEDMGDGYYILYSFVLKLTSSVVATKAMPITYRIYLGDTKNLNANRLLLQGTASIAEGDTQTEVFYELPTDKVNPNDYLFQAVNNDPTLWIVYEANGYTSSTVALTMYGIDED